MTCFCFVCLLLLKKLQKKVFGLDSKILLFRMRLVQISKIMLTQHGVSQKYNTKINSFGSLLRKLLSRSLIQFMIIYKPNNMLLQVFALRLKTIKQISQMNSGVLFRKDYFNVEMLLISKTENLLRWHSETTRTSKIDY